ncbi:DUF6118 family protein [Phenylobacterium montanum]|uniref:Uncharacterized protein n=1 Tax=Phenylobacterium montanum TaxID=2823693 RepID=A0A975FYZ7_9CAUL|nr:DUF6118 family protein [Caulobacter sp. S6]QUD87517.1 hypothetical protein KCG34_21075 [Caulobacter sp. S6]
MEQQSDLEEPVDSAALAFEGLRREVALLNVAIGGLAAERASSPDYSQSLAEIVQQVSRIAGGMRKFSEAPALQLTPDDVGRRIALAGTEARRQEQAALQGAKASLERAAAGVSSCAASARLAGLQNRRLLQVGAAALVFGAVLGVVLPGVVARSVPGRWAWPERMAAGLLHRDLWSAGERLLSVADPDRWGRMQAAQASAQHDYAKAESSAPPRFSRPKRSRSVHTQAPRAEAGDSR